MCLLLCASLQLSFPKKKAAKHNFEMCNPKKKEFKLFFSSFEYSRASPRDLLIIEAALKTAVSGEWRKNETLKVVHFFLFEIEKVEAIKCAIEEKELHKKCRNLYLNSL
jgi:hypothetical protein